jgi:hypothetical protein
MQNVGNLQSHPSPVVAPQALAWDGKRLWISSRDLGTLHTIDVEAWKVTEEFDPPGVVWAAALTKDGFRFTIGKGLNDDRYVYRYRQGEGFTKLFACPEFSGSYLSFDGEHLYLSQWYKGLILKVNEEGDILDQFEVGGEICGHTFANKTLYVLRGKENKDVPDKSEEWCLARVEVSQGRARVEDLARIPFASRSLTFDDNQFWSNHRAANQTVSFMLPGQAV